MSFSNNNPLEDDLQLDSVGFEFKDAEEGLALGTEHQTIKSSYFANVDNVVLVSSSKKVEESYDLQNKKNTTRRLLHKLSSVASINVTLSWKNVDYIVNAHDRVDGKKKYKKKILDNATGYAEPGEFLAIMGPSGSGKTTLLEALANVLGWGGKLYGDIKINERQREEKHKHIMQYMASNDTHISFLSVYENLKYACLFAGVPKNKIEYRISKILEDTGLTSCKDTRVGNEIIKGISKGQKRRLTFALALSYKAPIILADEPTSGLDAASALEIIKSLQRIADNGHTVVCTIHQPATQISAIFDKIYIMTQGKTAYFGTNKNLLVYFDIMGYPCPEYINPSDFILEIVNTDFRDASDVDSLLQAWKDSDELKDTLRYINYIQAGKTTDRDMCWMNTNMKFRVSYLQQLLILINRDTLNNIKNPLNYGSRIVCGGIIGIVTGYVFENVGNKYQVPEDCVARLSLLSFNIVVCTFLSLIMLPSLMEERLIFYRERLNGAYAPVPYCLSKFLSSIIPVFIVAFVFCSSFCFLTKLNNFWMTVVIFYVGMLSFEAMITLLSTISNSVPFVVIFIGAVIATCVLFGGIFIKRDDLMFPLSLLPPGNFLFYFFHALMNNEFAPIKRFEKILVPGFLDDGQAFLEMRTLAGHSIDFDLLMLGFITVGLQILYFLLMQFVHDGKK